MLGCAEPSGTTSNVVILYQEFDDMPTSTVTTILLSPAPLEQMPASVEITGGAGSSYPSRSRSARHRTKFQSVLEPAIATLVQTTPDQYLLNTCWAALNLVGPLQMLLSCIKSLMTCPPPL